MNLHVVITIALFVIPVALLGLAWWAWMGDNTYGSRRCPRCQYDMSLVSGKKCPECGTVAPSAYALHQAKRHPVMARVCAAIAILLLPVAVWNAIPVPWTSKLPRAVLREIALRDEQPPRSPAGLPGVDATLHKSTSAWDRLRWQQQVASAMRVCYSQLTAQDGTISDAECVTLVPMIDEVNSHVLTVLETPEQDTWMVREVQRLAQDAYDHEFAVALGQPPFLRRAWFMSAMVNFSLGTGYPDINQAVHIPNQIIAQVLRHPDAAVRAYGLRCMSDRIAAEFQMSSTGPPDEWALLEQMSKSDPDASNKQRAGELLQHKPW